MKFILIFIMGLFGMSFQSWGKAHLEIEGKSLAEKQVRWIWKNRNMLIKSCQFDSRICSADQKVSPLVNRLATLMATNPLTEIKFLSEKENPGFFISNQGETHRIAITSLAPDEPIYFNTDLINTLTLVQLAGILFHELTHKLGVIDDTERLADLVGANFAKHLQLGLQIGSYPLRNGKKIEMATFRGSLKENLTGADFDLGPIRGFGYLADAAIWLDVDFSKFELSEACSSREMTLAAQYLNPPLWLAVKDKPQSARSTVILNNMCVNVKSGRFEFLPRTFTADIKINNDGEMDRNDLTLNLGDNVRAYVDYYSTVELLQAEVPLTVVKAGTDLKISLKIRNKGEMKATKCESGFLHQGITEVAADGVMEVFNSCVLRPLGNSEYEVVLTAKLSPTLLSGTYRIPRLQLKSDKSGEIAFLQMESEVSWQVEGLAASSFKISDPRFLNLKPLEKLGNYPMEKSFSYAANQAFLIEFDISTTEKLDVVSIDLTLQIEMDGNLASSPAHFAPDDSEGLVKSYRFIPKGSGQVLQLEFKLPERFLGNRRLYGFRFDQILLQNRQSGEVALLRNSIAYRYLILSEALVGAN